MRFFFFGGNGNLMKRLVRAGVWSLLPLAFSSAALATQFTVQSQTYNIDHAGEFSAFVNSDPAHQLFVFCVDYRNYVSPPQTFDANISTLPNVSNARYGTTPQGGFSFSTPVPNPTIYSDAANRYLLAAWLIKQYSFGPGQNLGNTDIGIQNAIWTLLDVDGSIHNHGDESLWLSNAKTWEAGQTATQLAAFANQVVIYTSSNVADLTGAARYTTGVQEMIGFTAAPEPSALALLGSGLMALGLLRRRKRD